MRHRKDASGDLVRLGAAVRLAQLRDEIGRIYKMFPDLKFRPRGTTSVAAIASLSGRRQLTDAQRAAISERMTKLWAKRRKGES